MGMSAIQVALIAALAAVAWIFLILVLVTCCYTRRFVPKERSEASRAEATLTAGHFNCLEDTRTCGCACCFPMVRWGDTMDQANVLSFWKGFAMWAVVFALGIFISLFFFHIAFGWQIVQVLFLSAIFVSRQELRKKLNLPAWQCPTCCFDCLFVMFCSCCAIAQEARVVNHAIQAKKEGFAKPPEQ